MGREAQLAYLFNGVPQATVQLVDTTKKNEEREQRAARIEATKEAKRLRANPLEARWAQKDSE